MTKINRLTIHGFKSFAHKTDIPFEDEYNCILGPNGSGKSNIGDALCFVLGRLSAKSMRAEKASNLIFNGGKKNKPAAKGTVEIAFCNKENIFPFDDVEVTVSRTIKKSGSSEYRVNGKKHTRTQILDLLSRARINPDGYNIILQGDITRFVTMSPVERRKIIEEISDVSIYEEKKHKAMLELGKVEEKLGSAHIILKERGTHLKELKKDRDQALKFKELKGKIDSLKATELHRRIKEKETEKEKFDVQIKKHQEKVTQSEEKINVLKTQVQEFKEEISTINKEIEEKGEKQQVQVHKEIENLKVEIAKHKTRVSTLKDEINKIQQRKEQFKQELKELETKSSNLSKQGKEMQDLQKRKVAELKDTEKKIEEFKKRHKIESSQEIEQEIEEIDKQLEKKQEEVQAIRTQQQELLREKDRVEYQIQTLDERIRKVKEVEKENKEQIKTLQKHKQDFKQATLRLNKCLDQDSSFASQLANARKKIVELREKREKLGAKSAAMQARLASNAAIKSILDNKSKFKGVHGTVAQLGQVNKKYSQALEAAAGGRMNNIVVSDDGVAASCIKYLKDNKLGSASFIPLNKIRYAEITNEHQSLLKKAGVHDFALNLISFKAQYKKAFQYVFGATLVVEDINTARKVGIGSCKMATLDGNIAHASGVMQGGFNAKRSSLGFVEKDTSQELEKVDSHIAEFEGVLSNITTKREANDQEINSLRKIKAELEGEIIKLEKTLHLDTADLDATNDTHKGLQAQEKGLDDSIREIQRKISSHNKEFATLKSRRQILRSQISQLRNPRLLAQLTAFEETKQKCREDLVRIENELKNNAQKADQMYAPEREKILEIIKQHDKEDQQFTIEIKKLSGEVEKNEKDLTQKEKASKEFYQKYHELFNKRDKLNNKVNKSENDIESLREKNRSSEREMNMISLKHAEIKAKLAGFKEEFEKYKDAELLKNKPTEEIKREISRFEVMLGQMSAVNMKALEIYEQVEAEYNKLLEKQEQLTSEKTDVLTLMNEIETKKKEHFMKTFNHANENFQKIFTELFSKGKAYLELDNPKNPFDDGLSIKVKISGNRYMDIKSLSGGEKTMTALSFIFAIQEYQPASFYILDEIDAALDKHNAETLARLIRAYTDKAQYIVISHNDAVISEADTLFGISMKDGMSKVTSLKI